MRPESKHKHLRFIRASWVEPFYSVFSISVLTHQVTWAWLWGFPLEASGQFPETLEFWSISGFEGKGIPELYFVRVKWEMKCMWGDSPSLTNLCLTTEEGKMSETDRISFCHVFCLVMVSEAVSQSIAQASLELMGNPLFNQSSAGITGFCFHAQHVYFCF